MEEEKFINWINKEIYLYELKKQSEIVKQIWEKYDWIRK